MGNFSLPDPAQERTLPTIGQTEAKFINLINTKQKLQEGQSQNNKQKNLD